MSEYSVDNLPEGFKLITRFRPHARKRNYALSDKGEVLVVETGNVLVAPEGETTIKYREDTSSSTHEAEFDLDILLPRYFGPQQGLSQKDFDELVSISGLSAEVCRERLDSGWTFESSTDHNTGTTKKWWNRPKASVES